MIQIEKATTDDADLLKNLAIATFEESHGHSASNEDIQSYINAKFNLDSIISELAESENLFYLIHFNNELVGYSKIILNSVYNEKTPSNSTKLERLYVLKKHHGTPIGRTLMDFNIQLARDNNQCGMWLYVWTENHRAIRFYKKFGFLKIAETIFQISAKHANPNWIMNMTF